MNTRITDLSPLDQIRLVEAEVARRLVAAREAVEEKAAKVRTISEQLIYAVRDAGRKEGEAHYKAVVGKAEEEAQVVVLRARQRAEELKHRGGQRMASLTLRCVDFVLGWKGEWRADEH
ncbi:MAG: hypothetical protein HND47_16435 [Chloroflexi bacterium]|nr:hypothetical protein [Chloroflexota bacterium]